MPEYHYIKYDCTGFPGSAARHEGIIMTADPACTDPDKYQVIFENDRVRVLEYRDLPGDMTNPHQHPDSVMYTLPAFQRRLRASHGTRDVVMEPGHAHWLPAQTHAGQNIGTTPTHVLFVELKEAENTRPAAAPGPGPW
jgi:beta-alanine degradation protein BauB